MKDRTVMIGAVAVAALSLTSASFSAEQPAHSVPAACGEASHSGLVGFRGVRRRDRTGRVLQLGCSPHGCHPADADLANRRRDDCSS